jgi:hypothetical protein
MNTFLFAHLAPEVSKLCAEAHSRLQKVSDHFELIRDPGDRDTVRTLVEA